VPHLPTSTLSFAEPVVCRTSSVRVGLCYSDVLSTRAVSVGRADKVDLAVALCNIKSILEGTLVHFSLAVPNIHWAPLITADKAK
jgi:hypothetical protein